MAPAAGERRLELGRRVGVFAVGDPDTFGMTGVIIEEADSDDEEGWHVVRLFNGCELACASHVLKAFGSSGA